MEILFFYSMDSGSGDKLREIMEKISPVIPVYIFRDWNIFSRELMRPREGTPIAVILLSRREELLDAVSIRDIIHEYRLVLILPDREEGTVSLGHTLRPNFMTYKKGNLRELESVLKKMLHVG